MRFAIMRESGFEKCQEQLDAFSLIVVLNQPVRIRRKTTKDALPQVFSHSADNGKLLELGWRKKAPLSRFPSAYITPIRAELL